MTLMAPQKKKPRKPAAKEQPGKARGRPATGRARERGETKPFTLELPLAFSAALDECKKLDRRNKKDIVIIALEQYLRSRGLAPEPPDARP